MNRPAISLDVVSNLQPLEYSSGFFRGSGMQRIIVVTLLGVFVSLFPILSAYATTCEPNQYLDNGFCYTCPANATCDGTNFTCANGWYKNGGICQRCSVENSSCTGPDDYSCMPGFYDDNGTCAACPENATCPGGTEFFTCNAGYFKREKLCLSCAGHVCDGETLISCGAGYYKYYDRCLVCTALQYCPAGTESIICAQGAYKNTNGTCTKCPDGYYCPQGETNGNNIYDYCAAGYYRTGNSCTKCDDDVVCPGGKIEEMTCPGGLYKHDNGMCLGYEPGYCGISPNCMPGCWDNNGECVACTVENATCTGPNDFTCMAGYYDTGTDCEICPKNSNCLAGSTQIQCQPGYWLDGGECPQCGNGAYCINNIRYNCPPYVDGSLDPYLPSGHQITGTDNKLNALDAPIQSSVDSCSLETIHVSAPNGLYNYKWASWSQKNNAYSRLGQKYWYVANPGYYLANPYTVNSRQYYLDSLPCTNAAENSYYTGSGSVGGNDCPWLCNDGYYRDGNECLVCPDGLECVGGGIICPAGMYADKNQCVSCPAGYSDAPDGGAQSVNSCQKRCDGGYYVATAQSDKCENVGAGFWIGENYTNYGATGLRNACDAGMTTIGYGRGADDANDCGRVLNVGNTQIYLRRNKITTPSLVVRYNDDLLYGNMDTTERGNLRIQIGDTVYSVYDESML